jgi:hypothetical protein
MSSHRYPPATSRADYVRAGLGFLLTGGLAILARGETVVTVVLGVLALLFLLFGLRTWLRQTTVIEATDEGISTSGSRCVTFSWGELTRLRLRYYATKRDRTGGWMQLDLAAGRRRLSIESSLDGFSEIVRRAARGAEVNGLALDAATRTNLLALGIVPAVSAA